MGVTGPYNDNGNESEKLNFSVLRNCTAVTGRFRTNPYKWYTYGKRKTCLIQPGNTYTLIGPSNKETSQQSQQ